MTFAEFKRKWRRYQGKESSAYQEHFSDLCRLLGQPTPAEADPTGTVQQAHEFTNDQVDRPEHLKILRSVFSDPDYLKPQRTTAQVTENLAETIAEVAKSLQVREAVELADAKSRAEMSFAQRKN